MVFVPNAPKQNQDHPLTTKMTKVSVSIVLILLNISTFNTVNIMFQHLKYSNETFNFHTVLQKMVGKT